MIISTREVGRARIVEVDGDVDLGSSGDLRRTLFALLPRHPSWCSTWEASATSTAPASRL